MSGGPSPVYEVFKVGDNARIISSGQIGTVLYFYYWGGGILVKLKGIDNPKDPVVKCLGSSHGKGEFWQSDLEKVMEIPCVDQEKSCGTCGHPMEPTGDNWWFCTNCHNRKQLKTT